MRLKPGILQWAAVACFCVGLIYALGLEGGAQIGQPITDGEFITAMVLILTSIALGKPLYLVAFQPCRGLSTKEVFTALHEQGIREEDRPDNDAAQRALQSGNVRLLARSLGNVLEPVSRQMRPSKAG